MRDPRWKAAPKRGYVICPYCSAVVEDKGLVKAAHIAFDNCRITCSTIPAPGGADTP